MFFQNKTAPYHSSSLQKPQQQQTNYVLWIVKILLVLLLLLLLPRFVVGRNRHSSSGGGTAAQRKRRRLTLEYQALFRDCDHSLPTADNIIACGDLIPEESMPCITRCIHLPCHDEVYGGDDSLELGEADHAKERSFEECVIRTWKHDQRTYHA